MEVAGRSSSSICSGARDKATEVVVLPHSFKVSLIDLRDHQIATVVIKRSGGAIRESDLNEIAQGIVGKQSGSGSRIHDGAQKVPAIGEGGDQVRRIGNGSQPSLGVVEVVRSVPVSILLRGLESLRVIFDPGPILQGASKRTLYILDQGGKISGRPGGIGFGL